MQADVLVSSAFVDGQAVLRFGQDAALCAFPLNEMIATASLTVNDTTITMNLDTVMHEVLRMTDYRANRKLRTCPTMMDNYASYNDAYLAVNSPLSSYVDAVDTDLVGNGAWGDIVFTNAAGVALSGTGSYQIGSTTSYVGFINGIPVRTGSTGLPAVGAANGPPVGSAYVVDGTAPYKVYFRFSSCEKLLVSPFIFAESHEYSTGLFGLNNLQIVLNLKADVSRVLRSTTGGGRAVSNVQFNGNQPFEGARLNCVFLTPPLSLPLPAKNIVPFLQYPRYVTASNGTVAAGASVEINSQNIVLPSCPDMLLIYAKPRSYAATDGDFYLTPERISINWDNYSGILSSYSKQQLYSASAANGLDMSYPEWAGEAMTGRSGTKIATTGGFLALRLGVEIPLQEGVAPGLISNFSLQFNISVKNTTASPIAGVDLYVIPVNSGFLETMAGSSRLILGPLSEADIISAPMAPMGSSQRLARLVGEGFFSKLGSWLTKAKDIYTATKPAVSAIKGMLPEGKVRGALDAIGYGQAGGAMPAGGAKRSLSQRLM